MTKDKIFPVVSVMILAALVFWMSWRDMHPELSAPESAGTKLKTFTYYAGPAIKPDMVPNDNLPVTIAVPDGMAPTTFAQRQMNLLFQFNSLPEDAAEAVKKSRAVVRDWETQGNTVVTIFIDYRPQKADPKAYAAFLKAFREEFKNSQNLVVAADADWQKEDLRTLAEYTPAFLIETPQADLSFSWLTELAKTGYEFILQFPAGVLPEDVEKTTLKQIKAMSDPPAIAGYVFTLDPQKPWPKTEEGIGLFPKL